MNFFTDHPGMTFMAITAVGLILQFVMCVALVSIAMSLKRSNKKER